MSIKENSQKKVVITSKNPVKVNCVSNGFSKVFPDLNFEFVEIAVPSDVSDQPMSDSETLLGAKNRIKNAKKIYSQADFWVGIEGGLEKNNDKLEAFAYIIIESNNKTGISKTATFTIPDKLSDLIYNGMELGHADDIVFGDTNSKQKNGSVGILTKNLITRLTFYEQSVILALIPFLNTDLY